MGITAVSKSRGTIHRIHPDDIAAPPKMNGRYGEHDEQSVLEMAETLLKDGQLQPVIVRENPEDKDKPLLVFGFRRRAAAALINRVGLGGHGADNPFLLECKIRDAEELEAFKLNLHENAKRSATTPMDDAHNMHRLQHDFGMTQQDIADFYGMSVSGVNNRLQLLTLAPPVQDAVHTGQMPLTAALELLGSDEHTQQEAAKLGAVSVDAVKKLAAAGNAAQTATASSSATGSRKRGRPRKDPNSKVKTLKDVRNMLSTMAEEEDTNLSMLAGFLTAWMDGKISDKGLSRKMGKLFE